MIALALILAALLCLVGAYVQSRRRDLVPPPRPRTVPAARPRRAVRADVPHLLYRYEWAAGGDCYYGISNEPPARDRRHGIDPDDQWWYQRSTKVMHPMGWYPNRTAARAAERHIVRTESARGARLANSQHNTRKGRARVSR